jgi:ubiquinone/menaquinone biosynthesis C-methylase UbiE
MSKIGNLLFFRNNHICHRWLCFTFDNWFRKLFQKPKEIVKDYIRKGDRVIDVGPGIGFFTLPIAEMVGDSGLVIAVDIQERMLAAIGHRAEQAGLQNRIKLHLGGVDSPDIGGRADFILAFWMVHEVSEKKQFFKGLYSVLEDGGKFLMVEPKFHVTGRQFKAAVQTAVEARFKVISQPKISGSISVLFSKQGG